MSQTTEQRALFDLLGPEDKVKIQHAIYNALIEQVEAVRLTPEEEGEIRSLIVTNFKEFFEPDFFFESVDFHEVGKAISGFVLDRLKETLEAASDAK